MIPLLEGLKIKQNEHVTKLNYICIASPPLHASYNVAICIYIIGESLIVSKL